MQGKARQSVIDMHRIEGNEIDTSTGRNLFKDTPPFTVMTPNWANTVQEEMMYVIQQAGLPLLDQTTDTRIQLYQAIQALISNGLSSLLVGFGCEYWKNGDPALNGDRFILYQGQVIYIPLYSNFVSKTYVGDANNATAPAFYKTSDAGGTTRNVAGPYFVLPDSRAMSLKGTGSTTLNTRAKAGPAFADREEDRGQLITASSSHISTTHGLINSDATVTGAFKVGTARTSRLQAAAVAGRDLEFDSSLSARAGATTRDCTLGTNFGAFY